MAMVWFKGTAKAQEMDEGTAKAQEMDEGTG
eukprot:CAMPEP_0194570894 /NCGR_PEP_ID=MMETSP0292-20121207/8037_1 /TAXON_ID=39354 /ORGANISM="Heterosigma akashiwo, Strain CCMP2393" /LENGTH=30 /DNA_ID= /DNA_START= /DNA_END= /DNA_ORIENTATION=